MIYMFTQFPRDHCFYPHMSFNIIIVIDVVVAAVVDFVVAIH